MQDGRRNPKEMKQTVKLDTQLRKMQGMKGESGGRSVDFSRFDGAFEDGGAAPGGAAAAEATPARKRPRIHGL